MAKKEIVEQVQNCALFSDGSIRISNVRGSYVHVDKPWAGPAKAGEKPPVPAFSMTALLPYATHKDANALIHREINRILQENKQKVFKQDAKFARDGKSAGKEEYIGHWTVNARETTQPILRDREKKTIPQERAAAQCKSGYWYTVIIKPWYQDNTYGKRVNANLLAVQVVREDKVFGNEGLNDDDADEMLDDADEGFDTPEVDDSDL